MRWLNRLNSEHRTRLLSVVGAVVLVVLCATSVAVALFPGRIPLLSNQNGPRLGVGEQPGSSPSIEPSAFPSAGASVTATPSAGSLQSVLPGASPVKATYKTIALLGLGGFDTEVTVADPDLLAWTVVLVMPEDKPVENRSAAVVKMVQQGTKVTLTPINPPTKAATFTVRFPALLALGKTVTSCTVNGDPCAGI
jgi:hypothetical protein